MRELVDVIENDIKVGEGSVRVRQRGEGAGHGEERFHFDNSGRYGNGGTRVGFVRSQEILHTMKYTVSVTWYRTSVAVERSWNYAGAYA